MTYSPLSRLVEKCKPQAIEQVSTHSKITQTKSYLQIEHYNFQHGFSCCYYIKVTGELCVSLYPSASEGFAVEIGNINSPLSLPLLPNFVTNFPHSSNTRVPWLVESQTTSNPAFLTDRERGWLNSPSFVPFSKFKKVSLRIKHFNEMITRVLDYTPTSPNGHLSTTAIFLGGLSVHLLLFQPLQRPSLYNGHFFLSPRWLLQT